MRSHLCILLALAAAASAMHVSEESLDRSKRQADGENLDEYGEYIEEYLEGMAPEGSIVNVAMNVDSGPGSQVNIEMNVNADGSSDEGDQDDGHHDDEHHEECGDGEWDYGHCGPHVWPHLFPAFCDGTRQSPVDLASAASPAASNFDFQFSNYDLVPESMTINNNGHGFSVYWYDSSADTPTTFMNEAESYTFLQYHFHWGSDLHQGSEHTLDGHAFPAEIHLVHFKTAYDNVSNAIQYDDGLLVLGFFVNASYDNPLNNGWDPLLASIPTAFEYDGETHPASPHSLNSLLPPTFGDTEDSYFINYLGGLTTPTCNEVVHWYVNVKPIQVYAEQLNGFRNVIDTHGEPLVNNYRPPQPLNGRTFSYSFDF